MIELEVYAAGLRNIDKILELDHQLETIPGLRYKVDRSHDLVYLEMEEAGITLRELRAMFNKIGMGSATGAVVSVAICRELAPVLSALMVSGRVGAAMSAEIGTMKVTEQIDALRALAVYPVDYLVVPRALAMMISMPLLTAECIGFGIIASYLVAIVFLDINGTYYVANMVQWTRMRDLIMGVSKAFVFGILIVFISCHKGLTTREGAVGVGRATTEAVVISSLAVLISNFFLTMALNIVYPAGYQ